MVAINIAILRETALKIVNTPGFSTDERGSERAVRQWLAALTPEQRFAAEQFFIIRWLENMHAESRRNGTSGQRAIQFVAPPAPRLPAPVEDDEPDQERPAPVSELRFSTESPSFAAEQPELPVAPVVAPQSRPAAPAAPRRETAPPTAPVAVTHATPKPVQQRSWKVAAYRQMFPELTFAMQTPNGVKPAWEFGAEDIDYRREQIGNQLRAWQTEKSGAQARSANLHQRAAREDAEIVQLTQQVRNIRAEADRWDAAKSAMVEHGVSTVGELAPEVLVACGFRKGAA